MKNSKPAIIGLVFTHNLAFCRRVLRGIRDFAESRPHWVLIPIDAEPRAIRTLAELSPAGLIGHLFTRPVLEAVQAFRKPFVNVSGVLCEPPMPRVGGDDFLNGRMAARHFLDRGHQNFAFVGHRNHYFSMEAERGYREIVGKAGFPVVSYHETSGQSFDPVGLPWLQNADFRRWVAALPHPSGVFCSDDLLGFQMVEVCRQTGLRVPDELAIVGVDNDDLLCSLARPQLSSIALPAERIGQQAAALLDRLLRGRAAPKRPILVPPLAVVPRRSTESLALADAEVGTAVSFIRDQGHRPLRIRDVLAQVPLSRRSLQRRFRQVLGRTVLEEIRRVHIERACRLLSETDLPVHAVADRSGFTDPKQLLTVFRQVVGQTPTAYRQATRFSPGAGSSPG